MADYRKILHMLSPLRHVSPFDINMAVDAGFDVVVPYTGVEPGEVAGLIQDAIFSRGPSGAKRTAAFIGGKNALVALDMLAAAKQAMFPPFQISVMADPAGSFTTAAAMVAKAEKHLPDRRWAGRRVCVFGGTGVVGFAAAVIAAGEGAQVALVGYDGAARVQKLAADAKARFGVDLAGVDGSTEALKAALVKGAEAIFAAGRAGVQIVDAGQLAGAAALKVAADVNAVPPAGVAGIGMQDDGKPLAGGVGIGPLAIGNIKYKVEAGLLRQMTEADQPLCLDFRDAFRLARELVG